MISSFIRKSVEQAVSISFSDALSKTKQIKYGSEQFVFFNFKSVGLNFRVATI